MELTYPKTMKEWNQWNTKRYPFIPTRKWTPSGYLMLGCAKQSFDVYVAFTDEKRSEVWIEKTSILMGQQMLMIEDLVRIDEDEEFNIAHRFFINQGLLDGTKKSRENS